MLRLLALAALASAVAAGLTPLIDYVIPVWPSISCSNPGFDPPLCPTQDGSACQVKEGEEGGRSGQGGCISPPLTPRRAPTRSCPSLPSRPFVPSRPRCPASPCRTTSRRFEPAWRRAPTFSTSPRSEFGGDKRAESGRGAHAAAVSTTLASLSRRPSSLLPPFPRCRNSLMLKGAAECYFVFDQQVRERERKRERRAAAWRTFCRLLHVSLSRSPREAA